MVEAVRQLEDLGVIKPESKVFVSSLPKETSSVVVKYETTAIRISAVVPPQKLKVRVVDHGDDDDDEPEYTVKCKLKTPPLLMSISYSDIPSFGKVVVDGTIFLFVIDENEKDRIKTTPYLLANVHTTGHVCWGNIAPPWNLRSAYNMYWGSSFSNDLFGVEEDLTGRHNKAKNVIEHIKKYRNKYLKHQSYTDNTTLICGNRFWAAPKGADAVLITDNVSILSQIPHKYWLKTSDNYSLIIALANMDGENWIFESGRYKFRIAADFVTIQARYNKKLADAKKKYASLMECAVK